MLGPSRVAVACQTALCAAQESISLQGGRQTLKIVLHVQQARTKAVLAVLIVLNAYSVDRVLSRRELELLEAINVLYVDQGLTSLGMESHLAASNAMQVHTRLGQGKSTLQAVCCAGQECSRPGKVWTVLMLAYHAKLVHIKPLLAEQCASCADRESIRQASTWVMKAYANCALQESIKLALDSPGWKIAQPVAMEPFRQEKE
jgi:hypothetical protein